MTTLMINDLSRTEKLDRKAMVGVRGGVSLSGPMPSFPSFDFTSFFKSFNPSSSTQSVNQLASQTFNVGNNQAFAAGNSPTVVGTQSQNAINVNERN